MPLFSNLPGVRPVFLDGNLKILDQAVGPRAVVIGTGTGGPSWVLYPVTRPVQDAHTFGLRDSLGNTEGSLGRGVLEFYGIAPKTSLFAFRIGATPAMVEHIGDASQTVGKGITVTTIESDDEAGDHYFIAWDDAYERLQIWDINDTLIYDNNPGGIGIDLGLVIVSGDTDGVTGPSFAKTMMSLLDQDTNPALIGLEYTAGTDGANLTQRELYENLHRAYDILQGANVDIVVPMDISLDNPNIADDATLTVANSEALGWLKTEVDDSTTSGFAFTWSFAATKPDDYHEVNLYYQAANFCHNLSQNGHPAYFACGVEPPADYSPPSIRAWIGTEPTLDPITGAISANGTGLLGNKFIAGQIGFTPGFFATSEEELDGTVLYDENEARVDIGKYGPICAHWMTYFNELSSTGYSASPATGVAALSSLYPSKSSIINKALGLTVSLPFKLLKRQLNALSGAKFLTLEYRVGRGVVCVKEPVPTTDDSDYKRLSTTRIAIDVLNAAIQEAEPFIGEGITTVGHQALIDRVERRMGLLVRDGYIRQYRSVTISMSPTDLQLGESTLNLAVIPAFTQEVIHIPISLHREL